MRNFNFLFIILLLFNIHIYCFNIEQVYENLGSFNSPVDIQNPNDNQVFIVEQIGKIQVFNRLNPQDKEEFLDISEIVNSFGSEQGLLGLAFHPNYSQNRLFYVHYSSLNDESIISQFERNENDINTADISSEKVILVIDQPFANHNGGQLQFGPDGYLYIALGDGGSGNDPLGSGQDTSTLLGSLLRIDIDNEDPPLNYSIPDDNPFVSGGGLPEIYSYGLRNPWRFSFDSETGLIWIGDVGQNTFEEVSIVSSIGENFGWVDMEGCVCTSSCTPSNYVLPIHSYPRSVGTSITGGYVYHGSEIPELQDYYIFADYTTGKIFSIDSNNIFSDCGTSSNLLFDTDSTISSFGVINDEIYFADTSSGRIFRISPDEPNPSSSSPSIQPSSSIIPQPSATNIPQPPSQYSHSVSSSNNGKTIDIQWEIDGGFIHMLISAISSGYIAIGFSSDGSMSSSGEGSDIIMGYVSNGESFVNDYFVSSNTQPELDEQQNIQFTDAFYNGNILNVKFSRALSTGDIFEDRILSLNDNTFFIWAISDIVPVNIDSFTQHSSRESIQVILNQDISQSTDISSTSDISFSTFSSFSSLFTSFSSFFSTITFNSNSLSSFSSSNSSSTGNALIWIYYLNIILFTIILL